MIVAATNLIERLDAAGIREGRFDYKIEVPPPDLEARIGILTQALDRKLRGKGRKSGAIGIDHTGMRQACERWDGFPIARIRSIGEETAEFIKVSGGNIVRFEDVQAALRRIQGTLGTAIKPTDLSLEEMTFAPAFRRQIDGIVRRMIDVQETERRGGTVPTGILFSGPPGTGKTATGKAIAKATGWAFLATSGQDLLSEPSKIDKLLVDAANIRPCIVFIDEADDVLGDRNYSPHTKPITNKLLIAIDGGSQRSRDIVFIAATNNPQTMDSAALRGGRFSEKLRFELPDLDTVTKVIAEWQRSSKAKFKLSANDIAEVIGAASPANIRAILQAAVNIHISRDSPDTAVDLDDILAARIHVSL